MNCPYCSNDIQEGKGKFCPRCGHRLIRCATCGEILTRKIRYCSLDGTKVPDADYAELPDPDSVQAVPQESPVEEVKPEPAAEPVAEPELIFDEPEEYEEEAAFVLKEQPNVVPEDFDDEEATTVLKKQTEVYSEDFDDEEATTVLKKQTEVYPEDFDSEGATSLLSGKRNPYEEYYEEDGDNPTTVLKGQAINRPKKSWDEPVMRNTQTGSDARGNMVPMGYNSEYRNPYGNQQMNQPNPPDRRKKEGPNLKPVLIGVLIAALMLLLGVAAYAVSSKILNSPSKEEKQSSDAAPAQTESQTAEAEQKEEVKEEQPAADTKEEEKKAPVQKNTEDKKPAYLYDDLDWDDDEDEDRKPEKITAEVSKANASKLSGHSKARIIDWYSSSVVTDNDPSINNEASQMVDGDEVTSWQEGAPGDGIGEYAGFTFSKTYDVKYITFKMGNWRDQKRFNANNRPKDILLTIGDEVFDLTFPDGKKEYMVEFSSPVEADGLEVEILSVYKGAEWDDCCISEMTVYCD